MVRSELGPFDITAVLLHRIIRESVGPDCKVMVDANQKWSVDQVGPIDQALDLAFHNAFSWRNSIAAIAHSAVL